MISGCILTSTVSVNVRTQFKYFLLLSSESRLTLVRYSPILCTLPVCFSIADIAGIGQPEKVTWSPALKGQPHAPLQIFHLIKYTSVVSHTYEAALT